MPSTSIRTGVLPLICSALVPNIRAFSYLVMYGVVERWSLGTFLDFSAATVFLADDLAAAAALGSPLSTMLSGLSLTVSGSSCWPSPSAPSSSYRSGSASSS